jgi:cytoskeletal protein RodZ
MKKTALILAFAVASLPAAFGQGAGQSNPAPANPAPQADNPGAPEQKGSTDTANRKKKQQDEKKSPDSSKSSPDSSTPNPAPNAPPPQR